MPPQAGLPRSAALARSSRCNPGSAGSSFMAQNGLEGPEMLPWHNQADPYNPIVLIRIDMAGFRPENPVCRSGLQPLLKVRSTGFRMDTGQAQLHGMRCPFRRSPCRRFLSRHPSFSWVPAE